MERKEQWRAVPGYQGKKISNKGRVQVGEKSPSFGTKTNRGYLSVHWVNDYGESTHIQVSHLMARTFPDLIVRHGGETEIDHIDGNPLNNSAENLRWVTRKENAANYVRQHRIKSQMQKPQRAKYVIAITKSEGDVYLFKTIEDAARQVGCSSGTIRRIAIGEQKKNSFGIIRVATLTSIPGEQVLFR